MLGELFLIGWAFQLFIKFDVLTPVDSDLDSSTNSNAAACQIEAESAEASSISKKRKRSPPAKKSSDFDKIIEVIGSMTDKNDVDVEHDPDELFLKSILPDMKIMSDTTKLKFKIHLLSAIAESKVGKSIIIIITKLMYEIS